MVQLDLNPLAEATVQRQRHLMIQMTTPPRLLLRRQLLERRRPSRQLLERRRPSQQLLNRKNKLQCHKMESLLLVTAHYY
jgi:hypothetical protein